MSIQWAVFPCGWLHMERAPYKPCTSECNAFRVIWSLHGLSIYILIMFCQFKAVVTVAPIGLIFVASCDYNYLSLFSLLFVFNKPTGVEVLFSFAYKWRREVTPRIAKKSCLKDAVTWLSVRRQCCEQMVKQNFRWMWIPRRLLRGGG